MVSPEAPQGAKGQSAPVRACDSSEDEDSIWKLGAMSLNLHLPLSTSDSQDYSRRGLLGFESEQPLPCG